MTELTIEDQLTAAGIVDISWEADEDGTIRAEGLQSYEIETGPETETGFELAVFQGPKCVKVLDAVDLCHAAAVVYSSEAVCRWNLHNGRTGNGHNVNDKGWDIGGRAPKK